MIDYSGEAVRATDLVVRYDGFAALSGARFTVRYGEALGIVGPNGSGKSTLLKAVAGLLLPSSGDLCVLGTSPRKLAPGTIAYVPQVEAVDWSFPATVWDVVAMGRFSRLKFWRLSNAHDRDVVARAIDAVGMTPLAQRHISQLSGGQQQRAFVARALAQEPSLMLLDEPTTGVDAQTEESLRRIVHELVAGGMPVMMTTHDLDRVTDWFDRLIVLDRTVLAFGTPAEVVESGTYTSIREHTHTHGHQRHDK
ncbi:MAG: metal ABC transporter ATP-binding protein [Vulcanimicrobiaceae bacterium]